MIQINQKKIILNEDQLIFYKATYGAYKGGILKQFAATSGMTPRIKKHIMVILKN